MTFEIALSYLKEGKKVRRTGWGGCLELGETTIYVNFMDGDLEPAQLYANDILADDWMIVDV